MTLRFQLAGHVLVHEFGVVKDLPCDSIIGGEMGRAHECTFSYARTRREKFRLRKAKSERCDANLEQLRRAEDLQLQFNAS